MNGKAAVSTGKKLLIWSVKIFATAAIAVLGGIFVYALAVRDKIPYLNPTDEEGQAAAELMLLVSVVVVFVMLIGGAVYLAPFTV